MAIRSRPGERGLPGPDGPTTAFSNVAAGNGHVMPGGDAK